MEKVKKSFMSSTKFHYIEVDQWATIDEIIKVFLDKIETLEAEIEELKLNGN